VRTSVSNIGWGGGHGRSIVEALGAAGVDGVELAPTVLWPDAPRVDPSLVRAERMRWEHDGFPVVAVQSLFFGRPELQLLDPSMHEAAATHLIEMIELAGALGARVAVLGSPRNRLRGALTEQEADQVAIAFLGRVLPALERNGVVLTLEPNAPAYGADYITTYGQAWRLADALGSRWVRPQIDIGCALMVGDRPSAMPAQGMPAHVHASAPQLAAPDPVEPEYAGCAAALRRVGYPGWVTLEMRAPGPRATPLETSIRWLVSMFGEGE